MNENDILKNELNNKIIQIEKLKNQVNKPSYEWDSELSNKTLIIDGNTIISTTGDWSAGFSKDYISSGNISWKLRVTGKYSMIGIIPKTKILSKQAKCKFWEVKGACSYWIKGEVLLGNGTVKYGSKFKAGDVITVNLNMNEERLSFSKNNVNQGIVPQKINKNEKYHLAINLGGRDNKLELLL